MEEREEGRPDYGGVEEEMGGAGHGRRRGPIFAAPPRLAPSKCMGIEMTT